MRVALIVPIKSFAAAKGRLEDVLTDTEREQLARWCAERTVHAFNGSELTHDLSVIVVCEDHDVQTWCEVSGLSFVVPLKPGLNEAVQAGTDEAVRRGAEFVIVAHADLGHPDELASLLHERCDELITLVPDLDFNGTNVIAMPARAAVEFEFMYGPGSFARHAQFAESVADVSDLILHVVDDSLLSIDIDTEDDLMIPSVRSMLPFQLKEQL